MTDPGILHSIKIRHGKVSFDGNVIETLDPSFKLFSKELYNRYSKGYSKFFKMDNLSKLGFLSAEILLHSFEKNQMKQTMSEINIETHAAMIKNVCQNESMATKFKQMKQTMSEINIETHAAMIKNVCQNESMTTKFKQMKENEVAIVLGNSEATTPTDKKYFESVAGIPSPALFVYTLPNIMIGEISIKYGFRGENLFFVAEKFDAEELFQHVQTVLTNSEINWILAGWVNYVGDKEYESMLYLVAQNRNNCKFTSRNIMELYNYNFK